MIFKTNGYKLVLLLFWILVNIVVFAVVFNEYYSRVEYFYLRLFTGFSIAISRGSAACINVNCALILLPVCRHVETLLRSRLFKCCPKKVSRVLDNNLNIHKGIAFLIIFFTIIHYFSHCLNFERFKTAHMNNENGNLILVLSSLTNSPNPIPHRNSNLCISLLKTTPGWTGVVMCICLVFMLASSVEYVKRTSYEIFWFTHHFFIIFFLALMLHGTSGVVKRQTNTDRHDPLICMYKFDQWNTTDECPLPKFEPTPARSYAYVLPSLVIYLILEGLISVYWRFQKAVVTQVIGHQSNVLELQMRRKHFTMQPGQYVLINCRKASFLEWHPFTLTSAPGDDYFSVHIRVVGDWTTKVSQLFTDCAVGNMPSIAIDGPFGAPAEDALKYHTVILVGAGIGVTPFASILKHLNYQLKSLNEIKLQKIYFYWICNDFQCFEWFVGLLRDMEIAMNKPGIQDILDHHIYLTRGWDSNQAANIIMNENDSSDSITGLSRKTFYGRPNWNIIFNEICEQHSGSIGLFCCGPQELANTLKNNCNQFSNSEKGVIFYFNKENF